MASNFLTSSNTDLKVNSDTLSEISESGTGNSELTSGWDSKEDLRDLASRIGLEDVSELHQQRFPVNRKKLEHMLIADNEAPEPANTFFHKIMEDTNTYINWPSRLKIGARTKKDPHVKIAGRQEDVQTAKERIMNILDTRCNRVTMKLDLSYTDHSHIIGKEGLTIKRVMEETRCHVHFPDSNRLNTTEKSNQVSIAGDIDGVERARSRVRNLTPLIFSFELPIVNSNTPTVPNRQTPYVIQVEQQYNVQVMFRTRPKLYATLVMVKGSEWEIQQLKQATRMLVEFMCEDLSNQVLIQMSMEITPHHHAVVTGNNHARLKSIIRNTGTQIMFPDVHDPNIPSLRKSNVTISGNIHNVYIARQQLMGSLPLVLIFDLPEEKGYILETEHLANIESSLDVVINIRPKAKQNTMSCIIKGIESYATNMYEARHRILDIREQWIVADIPTSYFIPPCGATAETTPAINIQHASPLPSSQTWQPFIQHTPFAGMLQQPQFTHNGAMQNSIGTSGYSSLGQFPSSLVSLDRSREGSTYSSVTGDSPIPSPISSPINNVSPICQTRTPNESPISELSSVLSDTSSNSGTYYHSNRPSTATPDYEQKRVAGIRAMHGRQVGGYRTPTNVWSGYGISNTTPGAFQFSDEDKNVWTAFNMDHEAGFPATSTLNTSNILESTSAAVVDQITNSMFTDIPTMLTSLGLEKYIATFTSNEVDLMTFSSLTECDLTELGVKAFGARRKMMLLISEMNKRSSPFSPAPGAERRKSSPLICGNSSPSNNWQH